MGHRYLRTIPLLVLTVVLGACVSTFNPVSDNFKPRGKTLAVIAGLDHEANEAAAYHMSEALKKNTRFQVMSSKQIKQAIPGYPDNIRGPYKTAYFEIEVDYAMTDMKKIKAIQQQLGVDYLYVLWAPSSTVYNEKIHSLNIIAQMFESGKEVANGRFNAVAGRTDCCLAPVPDGKDKSNAVKDATE